MAGLVGTIMALSGIFFLIKPELAAGSAGLAIENTFGYSSIRGLIGGTMLMTAAFTFYAIIKNRKEALHATGMIALAWTIGRLLSLFMDGFDDASIRGGHFIL